MSVVESAAVDDKRDASEMILNEEKETVITAKTNSAADYETRIGDHERDTDSLIQSLVDILEELTHDPDDIALAGNNQSQTSIFIHWPITSQ